MIAIVWHLEGFLGTKERKGLCDHANHIFTERGLGVQWRLDEDSGLLIAIISGDTWAFVAGSAVSEIYHDWGRREIQGFDSDDSDRATMPNVYSIDSEAFTAFGSLWRRIGKEAKNGQ